ncbi:hypothetical protein PGT21_019384 [Puccinia graminis f. sp. tritici]|uniref:Uncharacterized protein n=1 Tax=Puccinia graminis f. sp. tritici TaxID=56615 RepID=A0A5B0R130_PUCGR|nr:hypothetical protein PGT21_019384 [Puccinia graminis f. sp. tritici]
MILSNPNVCLHRPIHLYAIRVAHSALAFIGHALAFIGYEPALLLAQSSHRHGKMSETKLPLLTDTNWTSWKNKILGYCMQHRLAKYLDSKTVAPTEATSLADFTEKQEQVAGILYQTIGDTNHQRFITADVVVKNVKIKSFFLSFFYIYFLHIITQSLSEITPYGSRTGLYG